MKFSHFVPNKMCYIMICILLFFSHEFIFFNLNFMLYSQNFWKCQEQENISSNFHLVGLNFISIIDGWNHLSLYQYMSWAGGCRTPMTIYKLEKPWFPLPIFVWCCLNCSMCFRDYSFVWVAISRQCFRD